MRFSFCVLLLSVCVYTTACSSLEKRQDTSREPRPSDVTSQDIEEANDEVIYVPRDIAVRTINSVAQFQPITFGNSINVNNNSIDNVGIAGFTVGSQVVLSSSAGKLLGAPVFDQINSFTGATNIVFKLAYGGGLLYAGSIDDNVYQVDPMTMTSINTFTGSGFILSLTFGDGFVYAGDNSPALYKIDPSNMNSVNTFSDPNFTSTIFGLTVGEDGFLYASGLDNIVWKIDPSTMGSVDTFTGGVDVRVLTFADGFLYAGSFNNVVHKVNPDTMQEVNRFTDTQGITSITLGNSFLYVAGFSDIVYKLDPDSMEVVDSYVAQNGIEGLAFGDDLLYAGGFDNVVWQIDTDTMEPIRSFTNPTDTVRDLVFGDGFLYAGGDDQIVWKFLTHDNLNFGVFESVSDADLNDYNVLLIDANGTQVARSASTADAAGTISSREYKRDIGEVFDDAVHRLMDVQPVQFRYRDIHDDGCRHYGVIAETLQEVMPELIRYDKDGNPGRVRYIEMIPLLLKKLQDEQKDKHVLYEYVQQLYEYMQQQDDKIKMLEQRIDSSQQVA